MTAVLLAGVDACVTELPGVGPAAARRLARLGLRTVGELLEHYPRSHEDRRRVTPLPAVEPGRPVVVSAAVTAHRRFGPRGRFLRVELADRTARTALLCFGRSYLARSLPVGTSVTVAATFERRGAMLEASTFEVHHAADSASFGRMVPVYPLTEGLRPALLRRTMLAACARLAGRDTPWDGCCVRRGLLPVAAAVAAIHFPPDFERLQTARRSLAYAELLRLQVELRRRQPGCRPARRFSGALGARVVRSLPFVLTDGQRAAVRAIEQGLRAATPDVRLLQGDVGSGKTLVALLSAAAVVEAGEQAALVVPTELLARQHVQTARRVLAPCGIRVELLTGGARPAARRELLDALRGGEIDLLLGTHALLQADVQFRRLGLVVVDEQHRFGVAQRRHLLQRNPAADLLLMTATPIPRSLALTVYGDLEVSAIRELPPGRVPVRTHLARLDRMEKVYARVGEELAAGGQAYFVVPRIAAPAADAPEPNGAAMPAPAAATLHATLSSAVYPQFKVGLIHGAMDDEDKHATMKAFHAGRLRILVATTVVEVGVDVAAATCMVVLGAERFGLATLHQLRGRVGRGPRQAYAFLAYAPDLGRAGVARLRAMKESGDGFEIAERDLAQRGPGELLGLRQAGLPELRVADLRRDLGLARQARRDAAALAGGRVNGRDGPPAAWPFGAAPTGGGPGA